MTAQLLDSYQLEARMLRGRVEDKTYQNYEIGREWRAYMLFKRGQITASTYRDYESCGDKLAREFPDLTIADFETPDGVELVERFLDRLWGDSAPRTYNKNLSIVKDFFKWAILKGKLKGNPTTGLVAHKKRDVHREVFNEGLLSRILANGPSDDELLRDRLALRLLLEYGLRKGALRHIQFKHFDATRRRLTIFSKGAKIREVPIPDGDFWEDLSIHQLNIEAQPSHFLMCRHRNIWGGYDRDTGDSIFRRKSYPEIIMGEHGAHDWWYGCLQRAGVVPKGTTRGERMHKARHSAGQAVLDETGNIVAVQKLLGHTDPSTTMRTYVDWDIDQLEATMQIVLDARRKREAGTQ